MVIRADKQVNLKELGEKLGGVRLSFASEERLEKYLGLKKGAVTPLGILNDTACAVKVFLDKDFLGKEEIGDASQVTITASGLSENGGSYANDKGTWQLA